MRIVRLLSFFAFCVVPRPRCRLLRWKGRRSQFLSPSFLLLGTAIALAQGGSPQGNGQSFQGQGSNFAFAGDTYPVNGLPTTYPLMRRKRLIWYKLVKVSWEPTSSSTQPLALAPLGCGDLSLLPSDIQEREGLQRKCRLTGSGRWYEPSFPDRQDPLVDGDRLVIAIVDPDDLIFTATPRIEFISLNIQASTANSLNPAPMRNSTSSAGATGQGGGPAAAPGSAPAIFPACQVVTQSSAYQSAPVNRPFPIGFIVSVTSAGKAQQGIKVTFTASTSRDGSSGRFQDAAASTTVRTDEKGVATAPTFMANSQVGSYTLTASAECGGTAQFDLINQLPIYYLPSAQPLNGDTLPNVTITALYDTPTPQSGNLKDPTPSTSIASDRSVILLTAQLPQVHSMFAYNLAFGVIGSSLSEPSFTRVANAPPCPTGTTPPGPSSSPCGTFTDSSSTATPIQPVVFLTTYLPQKFDAESHWRAHELWWPLAPGFGISLTQPSTDFFFGNSSEVRRGVQIVYGWHLAKVNYLRAGVESSTSSAPSVTGQHLQSGFFCGATFNINFVQSLFSGGGAK